MYARKGAINDKVFIHPSFCYQVDSSVSMVMAETGKIIISERGAGLGYFIAYSIDNEHSIIATIERIDSDERNSATKFEENKKDRSINTVFLGKIIFK